MKSRREFIKLSTITGAAILAAPIIRSCNRTRSVIPSWLSGYSDQYIQAPREAALTWFKNAQYGMMIHYGIYSLLGKMEWVQFTEKIPVDVYENYKNEFHARNFDADQITDILLDAGMRYIQFIVKHHDSFCLWDTAYSNFKSTNTPSGRDLLGELSVQCAKKGIALFVGYSHGRDWRHPHAPNPDLYKSYSTRPAYDDPHLYYKEGPEHELEVYVEFIENQVKELLSNYGNIAGISFGGASTILSGPDEPFHLYELYDMIHTLQPHTLISYGPGITGTEDYISLLRESQGDNYDQKIVEISNTMQPMGWGHVTEADGNHKSGEEIEKLFQDCSSSGFNLLLNTGPLPGGNIHPEDIIALKKSGRRIRKMDHRK